jgi:ubiquinone/menaquinone biosynthesis C-methylase UbiE
MSRPIVKKVIEANIQVHSRLAADYQKTEPHFRQENVSRVSKNVQALIQESKPVDVLDLGCGTGFMINILRPYARRIVGVDVTQAMLDQVDTSGPANIKLHNHDAGSFPAEPSGFNLVTAYSFLHHLADLKATLRTAFQALTPGGKFYADLDPNFYFWHAIASLENPDTRHEVVQREFRSTCEKDVEIQQKFGIPQEVFQHAEYGKDFSGGFKEEDLKKLLHKVGFSRVEFQYHWFLGQSALINSGAAPRKTLMNTSATVDTILQNALPLSRSLFKYLGFVATR